MTSKTVFFVVAGLSHYRVRFHELVRQYLDEYDVKYVLVVSDIRARERGKQDTANLAWALKVRDWRLEWSGRELIYQRTPWRVMGGDLIIAIQENKYLLNYLLLALSKTFGGRLAMFGHGRDYQSRFHGGVGERWKRWWSMKCDWWFTYTPKTGSEIAGLGFPADRITVFNNSVDTTDLRRLADSVSAKDLLSRRINLGLHDGPVGVFVGGLYPDKRLEFLADAAMRVRAAGHDLQLIVIGGGPQYAELAALAETAPWIKVVGPIFGRPKVEMMLLAQFCLNPGLVGLSILDCASVGLPMITTDYPFHSPEFEYLEHGVDGIVVSGWNDVEAYAAAVCDLLSHPAELARLARGTARIADAYTIEAMARRFADGVVAALDAPRSGLAGIVDRIVGLSGR